MTFWLERGWLFFLPGSAHLNFIGLMACSEDAFHGGFKRITGFGDGWVDLLAINYRSLAAGLRRRQFRRDVQT
jgi:hypothetical protein